MTRDHLLSPRTTVLFLAALPVLYFISRYNYNLFHFIVDGVSIVIAACVFMIVWNVRRNLDNDYLIYIGISFLFFAFLDSAHVLGNKNMGVFPEYGNLGPTLYIASRYVLSISLLIATLFIKRKLNSTLMFAVYSLVTLFILLSIFYWRSFPVCIVEGVGLTPFKIISDYIICLILLGAIGLLLTNRRSFDSRVFRLIVSSIILSIATGVAFTLYADPFGIMNAIGHFLQIGSFYLVYLAIIETSLVSPYDLLFRELKQSEAKFRSIFETNIVPIAYCLMDGRIIDANDVYLRLLGYTREDLEKGQVRCYATTPPEWKHMGERVQPVTGDAHGPPNGRYHFSTVNGAPVPLSQLPLSLALTGKSVVDKELLVARADDTQAIILSSATPLKDENGIARGAVTVFQDITERKLAEEKIRRQNALLESINSIFDEALSDRTEEHLGKLCLSIAERISESNFGFIGEIGADGLLHDIAISNPGWDLCTMHDKSGHRRLPGNFKIHGLYGRVLADAKSLIANDPFSHHDSLGIPAGHPPLTSFLGVPLLRDGKAIGMVAVGNREGGYLEEHRDALEALAPVIVQSLGRKRAEEALRESETRYKWLHSELEVRVQARTAELERRNEDLQNFTFAASHDLQEPLRKIQTFSDLIASKCADSFSKESSDYLKRMNETATRMRDVLQSLLKYSRLTSHAEPFGRVDLNEIVKEVISNLKIKIRDTAALVEIGDLPEIEADAMQMRQLLQNLLENALMFGREGEKTRVRIHSACNGECEIYVEDNGIGFEEKHLERIFKPYQRLHGKNEYGGVGMGLAICAKVVEHHGGTITAKSIPGQGSTFIVTLPVRQGDR